MIRSASPHITAERQLVTAVVVLGGAVSIAIGVAIDALAGDLGLWVLAVFGVLLIAAAARGLGTGS